MTRYSGTETKDSDADFLELEPVKSLVACKWFTYRWVYILWLVVHLSYMVVFTAITAEVNSAPPNVSHDGDLKVGRVGGCCCRRDSVQS